MKFKTFAAETARELEVKLNEWVTTENPFQVLEIHFTSTDDGKDISHFVLISYLPSSRTT